MLNFECAPVELTINGQKLVADPAKMHASWLARALEYGLRRWPNDSYSGEKGQTKYDLVRAMLADMQSGDPMPEKVRSSRAASADPVEALAFKTAKGDLLAAFKKRTGAGKIADILAAGDEAVNKFFRDTENGSVWNEESVAAWIAKRKEAGRDYMAEAEEVINGASELDMDI
jgi:hypothetical protein